MVLARAIYSRAFLFSNLFSFLAPCSCFVATFYHFFHSFFSYSVLLVFFFFFLRSAANDTAVVVVIVGFVAAALLLIFCVSFAVWLLVLHREK